MSETLPCGHPDGGARVCLGCFDELQDKCDRLIDGLDQLLSAMADYFGPADSIEEGFGGDDKVRKALEVAYDLVRGSWDEGETKP